MHSGRESVREETKEKISWDGKTFQLPRVLSGTSSPQAKARYFALTLQGLGASNAPALTKLGLLDSRFNFRNLLNEINSSLTSLLDTSSGQETPPIVFTPGPVFTLTEPNLRNQTAGEIPLPVAGLGLPQATRRNAVFYTVQVRVNLRQAYSGAASVAADASLFTQVLTVSIRLPRYQPPPGHVDYGFSRLDPSLTSDVLRDPVNTFMIVSDINRAPPLLGTLKKTAGDVAATHDSDAFHAVFMTLYNQTRYALYKVLLKQEFIGTSILSLSSLQSQLQAVKQMQSDPATRMMVCLPVVEYYDKFNEVLTMFPPDEPYSLDVAATFFSNLAPSLRAQADAEDYTLPPLLPGIQTVQRSTQRLRDVKDALISFEKKFNQVNKAVQLVNGRSNTTNRGGTRSFFASPVAHSFFAGPTAHHDNNEFCTFINNHENDHDALPAAYPAVPSHAAQYPAHPDELAEALLSIPDPATMSLDTVFLAATVFLSAAENALQAATGGPFPLMECWGCTNHPVHHDTRFHRWTECTHRGDRTVQDNAKKGLQAFISERQERQRRKPGHPSWGNPYGPKTTASVGTSTDWEQQGYPSKRMYDMVCTISNPATLPSTRKMCFQALTKGSVGDLPRKAPKPNNDSSGPLCLHFAPRSTIPVMQTHTSPSGPKTHLSISQSMPHVRFPVGSDSNTATIMTMVDTCAGLSLGRLSYHLSIFKTSPQLVHSFVYLKDIDYLDEFDIGGVDQHGNPTRVTAVITYKTPFKISGQEVLLSYGLSESASTNSILGLPFLRATHSAMLMTGSDDETLICQRLGATFRIEYQVPLRADQAPITPRNTHAAYPYHVETPPEVTTSLSNVLQLLTTVSLATPTEKIDLPPTELETPLQHDDTWMLDFDFPDIE
jgi:hypothetical protein